MNRSHIPVLFKADVDLANMSTQVVWARNSAMLVANSFIFVALGAAQVRQRIQLVIAVAGMLVCVLWLFMTLQGWGSYHYKMHDRISAVVPDYPFGRKYLRDLIFDCNIALIGIFLSVYVIFFFIYAGRI